MVPAASLIAPVADDGPTVCPVAEAAGSINMPTLTQANVLGAPGRNLFLGVRRRRVGVIVAADHSYPIFVQRRGHRCKSTARLWKGRAAGIRHGDKQGGIKGPIRSGCPVGNCETAQTMRDQNWRPRGLPHCFIQGLNPHITHRMIPIPLYYTANVPVLYLPQ
jgi:hypothetical protein